MSYTHKTILLATKHKKEQVIAPVFKAHLQCDVWVPSDFDTDQFGTFTGEIARTGSQYEALIFKAKRAAEKYQYDYVVSSEGSFGPHPSFYFVPGAIEMLAFLDIKNDINIVETLVTQETNFAYCDVTEIKEPVDFLKSIHFPSHGVIVRDLSNNQIVAKGIEQRDVLMQVIQQGLEKAKHMRIETDMRAHMNPTRMKTIRSLTELLVKRIATCCPACNTPGFGKIALSGNLCCEDCGTPTELYKEKVLNCLKCDYKSYLARDDGLLQASPQYCPYCNP
jgi:hypothetical protein